MKILFLEPPAEQSVGGLEAAIRMMAVHLVERGVEVRRATGREPGFVPEGCDLIHCHGLWQPAHARWSKWAARRGIPVVVSPHGMLEPWAWHHKRWKKHPYFYAIERAHLRRADRLHATAPPEEKNLRAFFPDHEITVLPIGLTGDARPDYEAARRALGWGDGRVLLYLSRLHPKKGLHLLLEALATTGTPPGTRLVIVGAGDKPYLRRLESIARRHQNRLPQLDWVGEIWGEGKWPYLQGADLFCLPTHSENFALAVLEALQVGTPVLTTTGTPWGTMLPPQGGLVVEPQIPELADALRRLLSRHPPLEEERTALAAWTREQFDWGRLAGRYAALYEDVLAQVSA